MKIFNTSQFNSNYSGNSISDGWIYKGSSKLTVSFFVPLPSDSLVGPAIQETQRIKKQLLKTTHTIVHKVTIICWGPMLVNHRVEKNKKLKQMRNISQITGLFKKTRISHIKKTKISWFRSLLELIGDKICSLADLFKNNPDINRLKSNDVRSSHWDMESTYLRKYKNFAVTEILRR